jgi:predicted dehydrogenase
MAEKKLRLGVLGAARNVPFSVMHPVKSNPDLAARIEVVGLASQQVTEAAALAKDWGIPKAYSYEDMLADKSIDAVYNVLPNPLRCQFTVRALQAGKHVLSETPFCSNAREAVVCQRAAEDAGRVLVEGTHPLCHPVTKRVREMIVQGNIGSLERIDLELPVGHSLQGKAVCSKTGALMGLGIHGVAIARSLAGEEPVITKATATRSQENPEVDATMSADFSFPSGYQASIKCSVAPGTAKEHTTYTISGSNGTINVKEWFTGGKSSNEISVEHFEESGSRSKETVDNPDPESKTTFYFQLLGFCEEVLGQEARGSIGLPWSYKKTKGPADGVRNMAAIDAIYRAANMSPKPVENLPPQPYDRIGMSKL